jgi:hypothetical protein
MTQQNSSDVPAAAAAAVQIKHMVLLASSAEEVHSCMQQLCNCSGTAAAHAGTATPYIHCAMIANHMDQYHGFSTRCINTQKTLVIMRSCQMLQLLATASVMIAAVCAAAYFFSAVTAKE